MRTVAAVACRIVRWITDRFLYLADPLPAQELIDVELELDQDG